MERRLLATKCVTVAHNCPVNWHGRRLPTIAGSAVGYNRLGKLGFATFAVDIVNTSRAIELWIEPKVCHFGVATAPGPQLPLVVPKKPLLPTGQATDRPDKGPFSRPDRSRTCNRTSAPFLGALSCLSGLGWFNLSENPDIRRTAFPKTYCQ